MLLLPFLLIILIMPTNAGAVEHLNVKSAILIDEAGGRVLYAQNEHERLEPASITKVMTMLLIMEAVDSGRARLNEKIRTSRNAENMGGSQVYLKEGEIFPLSTMIECIAVVSANDASTAVAEALFGGTDEFIDAMNAKAKALGAKDTHFQNETGLPAPDHYSSAYDMALFGRELVLKHPRILRWTSEKTGSLRGGKFILRNTNKLLWTFTGADGLKTGHTDEAGFCLVGTAKRAGFRLLSVVFGAPTDQERILASSKLLEYGFRNFVRKSLGKKGQVLGTAAIKGAAGKIPIRLGSDLAVVIKREEAKDIRTSIVYNQRKAPLPAGVEVGRMVARLNGEIVGSAPVITQQKVPRANFLMRLWMGIVQWISGLFGKKT